MVPGAPRTPSPFAVVKGRTPEPDAASLYGMASPFPSWRTLFFLGRISNLPTVWSNVLVGWWLAGGGFEGAIFLLLAGATSLYLGGMYLNDACDRDFDRRYRKERPLPSGAITLPVLLVLSWGWMLAGTIALLLLPIPVFLTLGLAASIVLYDFLHKKTSLSPLLMAACRLLLCLVAGAGAAGEVTWLNGQHGLVLAAYIIALSYLARRESMPGSIAPWPYPLLVLPPFLFLFPLGETPIFLTLFPISLFLIWMIFTLWPREKRDIGQMVSRLLAGIILVDLAALGGMNLFLSLFLLLFFLAALVMQRYIPAT